MSRCMLVLLLCATGQAQEPPLVLVTKDAQRVVGMVTYTITAPKLRATEWVVFAALAPELPGQKRVDSRLAPKGVPARERSGLARPILVARIPGTGAKRTSIIVKATYEATLRSRHLKPLATGARPAFVPPLTAAERKGALASVGEIDHASAGFQGWLTDRGFRRKRDESDLGLGRRVFLGLRRRSTYHYVSRMDRKASSVCRTCKSDCGGLANVFVAAMRANKVPARALYGRWAESAKADDKLGGDAYYQWHVKAEFFAVGVGWVPVDVSSGVLHDKTPEGLRFFGQDAGDFLTFHVDPDLKVDTLHFGVQPLGNLQTPAYWVTGGGTVDLVTYKEGWTVRAVK